MAIAPFQMAPQRRRQQFDTQPVMGNMLASRQVRLEDEARDRSVAIGNRLAAGDTRGAMQTAYQGGDLDTGMVLQKQQVAAQKATTDAARERELGTVKTLGGLALLAKQDPAVWQRAIAIFQKAGREIPPQYLDPVSGPDLALAEVGQVDEYLKGELQRAGLDLKRQQIGLQKSKFAADYERQGRPQPPRMTPTLQKEIFETDDTVQAAKAALGNLSEARRLSETAWSGLGANFSGAGQYWSKGAQDAQKLRNIVTAGALENLRATFGGQPTEGERKILLEIQGTPEQPREVRDAIFKRAIQAAQRRQAFNEWKAGALRDGSYFMGVPPEFQEYIDPAAEQTQKNQSRLPAGYKIERIE